MPSVIPRRNSPLPGFDLSLGITIPPAPLSKEIPVIRSSKFHLDQVDESYFQHLREAFGIAFRLATASAECALHSLIPGLCTRSSSRRIAGIHAQLMRRSDSAEQLRHARAQFRPRAPAEAEIEDA